MKLEIIEQKDAPILSRKEILAMVHYKGATPSRDKIREAVAVKASADKTLVIVTDIKTEYGSEQAQVVAHVYADPKMAQKYEPTYVLKKHEKAPKEEPAADKPAEEKPEEKPAEPKSAEEKPAEEKPEEKAE